MKLLALTLVLFAVGCAQTRAPLTQVDAYVWRSGHPETQAEWVAIRAKGVTDAVQLDFDGEDPSAHPEFARGLGITVHVLSIQPRGDQDIFDDARNTFVRPDPDVVARIDAELALAGPGHVVLVQCRWGHDRTGFIIVRQRVLRDGWTKDRAYAEAKAMGFHTTLHGLNDAIEDWKP